MKYSAVVISLFVLFAIGCRGVDDNNSGTDSGLSIGIIDGPTEDADEVIVTFTGVEIKPVNETAFTVLLRNPESVDLLEFQDGERFLLLDDYGLEDDTYSWIRLLVDESASYILLSNGQFPLILHEDSDDKLQINRGFTFTDDTILDFTIDFDLRQSIYQDSNDDYIFRPVLRVVDTQQAFTISGTIADALVDDLNCDDPDLPFFGGKAVYLFDGHIQDVQDIQDEGSEQPSQFNPVATATIYNDQALNEYRFDFFFVEDGDYRLSFTCFAQNDDPIANDSSIVEFSNPVDISVVNGVYSAILIE